MSEAPSTPPSEATEPQGSRATGLMYAIFAAMQADLGCIIGAAGCILLIVLSAVFAAQITPCTSAGGIPCAH